MREMSTSRAPVLLTVFLTLVFSVATAQTPAPKPLSERVVAYQINARFDADKKTLDATETLTYRNLTGQPQDTFPFHLYLNGFQPKLGAKDFKEHNQQIRDGVAKVLKGLPVN